jgi:hypothetical protein
MLGINKVIIDNGNSIKDTSGTNIKLSIGDNKLILKLVLTVIGILTIKAIRLIINNLTK